jgi:hypothetical protein
MLVRQQRAAVLAQVEGVERVALGAKRCAMWRWKK